MWLLIAFIAVPLIEIALFIQVGGAIGLWPTLLVVIVTALLGTYLVRKQGTQVLADLRHEMTSMQDPARPLAHGAMILFSGALLLTPGFFTDAVGFALLIPNVRQAVFDAAKSRIKMQSFSTGQGPMARGPIIEGDYEVETPSAEPRKTEGPSGWTNDSSKH